MKKAILFVALFFLAFAFNAIDTNNVSNNTVVEQDLFEDAVELIIEHEGWHTEKHYPYVGYGHKLLPTDNFKHPITEDFAKQLVRKDLLQKCSCFRSFGKDSLLLGVLAYNVGENNVLKSNLIKKLKNGDRNIYSNYISFCRVNGKINKSIMKRRINEYQLLFNKTKYVMINGF